MPYYCIQAYQNLSEIMHLIFEKIWITLISILVKNSDFILGSTIELMKVYS